MTSPSSIARPLMALVASSLAVGAIACGGELPPEGDCTLGGCGFDRSARPIGPASCPGPETLEGIDVSAWQGTVDWSAVAASGRTFAFARVSDGLSEDRYFDGNWQGMKEAGLIRGVYQFFRPSRDVAAQADLLLQHIGALAPGDLPPVIDVETAGSSNAALAAAVGAWIERVETATGRRPIIYSGGYFWDDNVGSSAFSDYPLWLPSYSTSCPRLPSPWSGWAIHQYSDSGAVGGVDGNCDVDKFNGTLEDLTNLAGGTEPPPPPPPPTCPVHCEDNAVIAADCTRTACDAGTTCQEEGDTASCVEDPPPPPPPPTQPPPVSAERERPPVEVTAERPASTTPIERGHPEPIVGEIGCTATGPARRGGETSLGLILGLALLLAARRRS